MPVAAGLLALALAVSAPGPTVLFTLPPVLSEVSGMAYGASGTLFVHQDSGSAATLTALTGDGEVRASYDLGVQARDWEDLAAGPRGTLLVADIGDNRGVRDLGVLVHRISEPIGPSGPTAPPESIRLRYADAPQDAETLLVHPTTGQTLVVTKGLLGSTVYAAPQPLTAGTLRAVATVPVTSTDTEGGPAGIAGVGDRLVTGGAVSADGRRLVVRTYTDAYIFRVPGEDLVAAFDEDPVVVPLPPTAQGEAVTWTPDGSALVTASEGTATPVQRVPVPEPDVAPQPDGFPQPGPPAAGPAATGSGIPVAPWLLGGGSVLAVLLVTARWSARRRRR